ncbi:MAG: ribosomal-processing cysteine protease Prp [Pelosinus sp.]|nr:ribosomal-processing cysteine protease Prp [Pelosinus sp.]
MIKIKTFRNSKNVLLGFVITGHANAAPHGKDIICAAVSILAQTAVYGLERHLKREISLDIAEGKLSLELNGNPDELTSAILETAFIGLQEIAKEYPKRVRIFDTGGES